MEIQLQSVSKSYSNRSGTKKREVLQGINLEIESGRTVAITGASGTGKSTLLNLIGTLDKPDAGTILLDKQNISEFSEANLANLRNQKIGFVFQQHHLMPQLNVFENILLPTLAFKNQSDKQERANELIRFVGLEHVVNQKPGQLSGGECQRVAVIRALINNPGLLLADEPTGSLDETAAKQLIELLLSINKEFDVTIIMVTHNLAIAKKMQQQLKLSQGNIMTLSQ